MNTGGNPSGGFTIVETLIVLAVTGALFVAAAVTISGRQNRTQFATAVNNIQQQIQQVINETESGFFPDNNDFICNVSGGVPNITAGVGTGQGSNTGCVFLGKVMQFGLGAGPETFAVHSIAGNGSATNVVAANAVDIYNGGVTNILQSENLESGLTVNRMKYDSLGGGSNIDTAGVAFLAGDDSGNYATTNSSGNLNSGSQQFSLYAVKPTKVGVGGDTISSMASKINSRSPNTFQHAKDVKICFLSGTTNNQSALVTIGDNASNSQLTVQLAIKNNSTCA
jgi:type II secretory pathway pseudopilin PulG